MSERDVFERRLEAAVRELRRGGAHADRCGPPDRLAGDERAAHAASRSPARLEAAEPRVRLDPRRGRPSRRAGDGPDRLRRPPGRASLPPTPPAPTASLVTHRPSSPPPDSPRRVAAARSASPGPPPRAHRAADRHRVPVGLGRGRGGPVPGGAHGSGVRRHDPGQLGRRNGEGGCRDAAAAGHQGPDPRATGQRGGRGGRRRSQGRRRQGHRQRPADPRHRVRSTIYVTSTTGKVGAAMAPVPRRAGRRDYGQQPLPVRGQRRRRQLLQAPRGRLAQSSSRRSPTARS